MNILITGGSGFLGRELTDYLQHQNHRITWGSRNATMTAPNGVQVISYTGLAATNDTYDVIINLAGAGIADKRWSNKQKQHLYDSRLNPTQAVLDYIKRTPNKPKLFISGSATGWYGIQASVLTEQSNAHDEFTHRLCDAWEQLALTVNELGVKTTIIRTGVVMSPTGGMVKKLCLPFSLGVGGKLGNGQQQISWISLADWVRAVDFIISKALDDNPVASIYNLTAPTAITNTAFTKIMGQWLKRPTFFTQPAGLLKLIFGEMSVLLLGNQQVVPQALLDSGFEFLHTEFKQSLDDSASING